MTFERFSPNVNHIRPVDSLNNSKTGKGYFLFQPISVSIYYKR